MTAVERDGSPPHFHSPLRIGEVMKAPIALEPQNETPHAHPYLPCSPHACDVLRDAQPTHALTAQAGRVVGLAEDAAQRTRGAREAWAGKDEALGVEVLAREPGAVAVLAAAVRGGLGSAARASVNTELAGGEGRRSGGAGWVGSGGSRCRAWVVPGPRSGAASLRGSVPTERSVRSSTTTRGIALSDPDCSPHWSLA